MEVLKPWIQLLLPGDCYDEFLVHFNFFDVPCWKLFISKCLGYAIILGSVLVKLPQILKVIAAKSGEGLSVLALYLELVAFISSCAYGYASKFPFSVYGDSLFMMIQNTILVLLVLGFSGQTGQSLAFMGVQTSALWFLFSGVASFQIIWGLQAANMPIVVISKMIQAATNYRNGSTGQLSAITVGLMFVGCVARVFTSLQETGDMTLVLNYLVASVCNGILLGQVIYYWNADKTDRKKKT